MKKILIFIILIVLSFSAYAKEYAHVAVRIKPSENLLTGMVEYNGKRTNFNYDLKKAHYNDGNTFVIYGDWMPDLPEGVGVYMYVFLPDKYMMVTESNRSKETYSGIRYEFDNPNHNITIAFSDKWIKQNVEYKGVDISTYFTIKNRIHSYAYFERIKELMEIYNTKLGKYPYDSFNVVEVPFPAGHALTSMTFISSSIIGMPFLTDISLGHELVHQWLGVAVSPEYEDGNWAEGLTTFFADKYFAEQKLEAVEYRKNTLLSYMAHARQKEDGTCLMGFHYNKDKKSQAIGYAKSMMVFTMLENILGKADFEKAIRIFIERHMYSTATWDDLIITMEDISGVSLRGFINGWLTETALADFDINDLKISKGLDGYNLSFNLKNRYNWLEYPLEVIVKDAGGNEVFDYLYVKEDVKSAKIKTKEKPVQIIIDPDYKVARLLTNKEVRPTLHSLFSSYDKVVFVNPEERAKYAPFIMGLTAAEVVSDKEEPRAYTDKIMVFLGENNRAFKKMYKGETVDAKDDFSVKTLRHPLGTDKMSYVVFGKDADTIKNASPRIKHYGKYSALHLKNGGHQFEKTIDKSVNGIVIDIKNEKGGVAVQKPLSINEIVKLNADAKLFLVGENHDNYAHHDSQLQFIKELKDSGKDVAVGLEMFQRKFQPYLDSYLAGKISQAEMLKKTEYYDRWRFDFRLYKPIFDYAKANNIPLIALNMEQEITKQVSSKGIPALGDDELASIPADIEYTGGAYKDFLLSIFKMHESNRKFEHFYEAQLLWDETMADTAAKYMADNKDKTMVVLAGNGHIRFRYGIADRLERRTGVHGVTVVQDENYVDGIADYILYPDEIDYEKSPKIGVVIDETDDGVLVKKVMEKTIAERAGVLAEDYIISLDGKKIHDLSDIRLALLYAKEGAHYRLKVKRGDNMLNLSISF